MRHVRIKSGLLSILTCLTIIMLGMLMTIPASAHSQPKKHVTSTSQPKKHTTPTPQPKTHTGPFDPMIKLVSSSKVVITATGCTVVTIGGHFFYPNTHARIINFDLKHSTIEAMPEEISIDALGRMPTTDVTLCGLPKGLINKLYINLEDQQTSFNSNTLIVDAR